MLSLAPSFWKTSQTASADAASKETATRLDNHVPIASSSSSSLVNGHGNGISIGIAEGSKMRDRDRSAVADSGNESTPGPSSAAGGRAGEGKKKKRKGWKGWAMVIEDEQGNIIDVTDAPEPGQASPPRRARGGRPSSASASAAVGSSTAAAAAPASAASEVVGASASAAAVLDPTRPKRKATTPIRQRPRGGSSSTIDTIDTEPEILPKSKRRGLVDTTPIVIASAPDPASRDSPSDDIFEPDPKRARRNSFSTHTPNAYPQPSLPHEIMTRPAGAGPRHSLPKSKPPRPVPTRTQPNRGGDSTQPNSARATPAAEDKERTPLPLPRVPRSGMGVDGAVPPDSDVRSEAAYIIAQAAKRREAAAAAAAAARVTPPAFEATPHTSAASSSNAFVHPLSPPRSTSTGPEPIIVRHGNDETEEDFDTAFEKVQEAYRHGIRPHRNPLAPQERTVPILGMEDADPPHWRCDQRPGVALAPGRDRLHPTDKDDLAHRQGYDGLTEALNSDATGFVNNVKDNIQHIVTYYFPQPSPRRDAFLESIGRGLANLGWQLTDSSAAVLSGLPPPLPLPTPTDTNHTVP